MPRFFACFAVQKAAAVRRNGLLPQAFCRHSIQHEGTPAPSYSPCETERFFSKQKFFDKLSGEPCGSPLFAFPGGSVQSTMSTETLVPVRWA